MVPLTRRPTVKNKPLVSTYLCFIYFHSAGRLKTNLIGMGIALIKHHISEGRTLFSVVYHIAVTITLYSSELLDDW